MRKMITFQAFCLSSALLLLMPVQAEETLQEDVKPEKEKKGFLQKFDSDGDGKVSKDEFKDSMGKRFQHMDSDHNGTISIEEFQQYRQQQRGIDPNKAKAIAKHDSDADGKLSKEEFLAPRIKRAEEKFIELDKNNDGMLSADEIPDTSNQQPPKKANEPSLFPNIDANQDGEISDEEKNAAFEQLFDRLDQNQDQIVTEDEVKAGRKK